MPNTTCPHCGVSGFVRHEHVIKATTELTQFYCGKCNRSWSETDKSRKRTNDIETADRSQS
jgi:transposase-like protein